MKNIKALSYTCKVLTAVSAVATALFFFFDFYVIKGFYTLTGIQVMFGSSQTVGGQNYVTYKSSWYITAFLLAIITAVFVIMNCFKFKRLKYWAAGSSLLLMINMFVLYCVPTYTTRFDVRTSPVTNITNSMITRQPAVTLAFIGAIVVFVLAVVTMFVADYAEVLDSKGAKLPIFKRIINFFKDYKSEIKKIVWPSRGTVVKNVIIVVIMCVVIGAFIWLLDFGLSQLFNLIVK
ncbi:MAG: preprotein translocase subunit SecE [Acutalibacteraceae bacterium]